MVGDMHMSYFRLPGGSQSAITCRLIRSQTLRQQLGKYMVKSLPGRKWEIGIFACSLCADVDIGFAPMNV